MSELETLRVTRKAPALEVALNRPARANALTRQMIAELHRALDMAEADPAIRLVALAGEGEAFCSGMDFVEAAASGGDAASLRETVESFYSLLERFTTSSVLICACVAGRVTAGGVGLVAAADHAIATPGASFQLSEVAFGLLPATIAPFIIRRCGLHPAYRLALGAERIDAARASSIGLVDEIAEAPAEALRRFLIRVARVDPDCVSALKGLFRELWIVNEGTRRVTAEAISRQILRPETQASIRDFIGQSGASWKK
jgi:polyketide biosynthesis enoyl-CoA hydratase PksH